MPKNIILLSDGTGNSASKLFKTNVWRLYQALELSEPDPARPNQHKQIAYYDDGAGTASFKPLALFGGAFGWGTKRNVLDLYTFLCRHYEEGDSIYGFGFSRGAFTIRVLTGFIHQSRKTQWHTIELSELNITFFKFLNYFHTTSSQRFRRWLRRPCRGGLFPMQGKQRLRSQSRLR